MKTKKAEVLRSVEGPKLTAQQKRELRHYCDRAGHSTDYICVSAKVPFRRCLCGARRSDAL